jgi:hypothetical protein
MDERAYQRFLRHVNKNGIIVREEIGCCWEWLLALTSGGYGKFEVKGKGYAVHRWSYMYHKGEIPVGMLIRHACDNRKCVNPDHLSVGTHADNMRDMKERKRAATGDRHGTHTHPQSVVKGEHHHARINPQLMARGERHGTHTKPESVARGERSGARLHPERLLRGDAHYSRTKPELLARGEQHGRYTKPEKTARGDRSGARTHPERIPRGDNHPARLHPERMARGENNGNTNLTEDDVREIRIFYGFAFTQTELAKMYKVGQSTIGRIVNFKVWKHVI